MSWFSSVLTALSYFHPSSWPDSKPAILAFIGCHCKILYLIINASGKLCMLVVVVWSKELQHLLQGQLYLQYAVQTTAPLRELLQTVFCSVLSGDRFLSIACKQSEHYVGRTLYHRKSYRERQFCIVTNQHAKTQNNDPNNQPIHS